MQYPKCLGLGKPFTEASVAKQQSPFLAIRLKSHGKRKRQVVPDGSGYFFTCLQTVPFPTIRLSTFGGDQKTASAAKGRGEGPGHTVIPANHHLTAEQSDRPHSQGRWCLAFHPLEDKKTKNSLEWLVQSLLHPWRQLEETNLEACNRIGCF